KWSEPSTIGGSAMKRGRIITKGLPLLLGITLSLAGCAGSAMGYGYDTSPYAYGPVYDDFGFYGGWDGFDRGRIHERHDAFRGHEEHHGFGGHMDSGAHAGGGHSSAEGHGGGGHASGGGHG